MADEQYPWLDRETVERLLSGESPGTADADARVQAERLAQALGALAATPPPTSDELPGEAAALAAFRKARDQREEHVEAPATAAGPACGDLSDAGLFRIGVRRDDRTTTGRGARRHRPLRLALAAALAAGMIGGVAFAAGTGVLPTPFDEAEPAPGASVSAAATPNRPLITPSPEGTHGGTSGLATPDPGEPSGEAPEREPEAGRDGEDRATPPSGDGDSGRSWTELAAACRAVRDGRGLDADRRRALEEVAGGSGRVTRYCENALRHAPGGADPGKGNGKGDDNGKSTGKDEGNGNGGGNGQGHGAGDNGNGNGQGDNDDDDGHGIARPGGHGHDGDGDGPGDDDRRERPGRASLSPRPSFTPPYTTG
ncbi:hypothetical protein ACWDV7_10455 [Streptomyces sp. NPDC003362]